MGRRTSMDNRERRKVLHLPGLKLRPLGHRASSQSLCRLLYRGSHVTMVENIIDERHAIQQFDHCYHGRSA
jgi:hypothetical protein